MPGEEDYEAITDGEWSMDDFPDEVDPEAGLFKPPASTDAPVTIEPVVEPSGPVLTPEERTQFVNALHLGKATREVTILGKVVAIQTLTVDLELQVAILIKPWEGTQGYTRAFMSAVAAASILRIDGTPFFTAINEDDKKHVVERKFTKICQYFPIFVDQVYGEFRKLEMALGAELLEKLGKSQG